MVLRCRHVVMAGNEPQGERLAVNLRRGTAPGFLSLWTVSVQLRLVMPTRCVEADNCAPISLRPKLRRWMRLQRKDIKARRNSSSPLTLELR